MIQNDTQFKIINILNKNNNVYAYKSLRAFGRTIGVDNPENIRHHFNQLEKMGYIVIDYCKKTIYMSSDRISIEVRNLESQIIILESRIKDLKSLTNITNKTT